MIEDILKFIIRIAIPWVFILILFVIVYIQNDSKLQPLQLGVVKKINYFVDFL